MSKQQGGFQIPPNLAIAEGATTPDPGGTSARGVIVWSTTLSAMVRWSGTAWNAMASGGGGFTNTVISVTPAANQQNWTISGRTNFTTVLADPAENSFIGGIAGGASGDVLIIENASASGLIWVSLQDVDSTAANRIAGKDDQCFLAPGDSIFLVYSSTLSRWSVVSCSRQFFAFSDKGMFLVPGQTTSAAAGGIGATVSGTFSTLEAAATGSPLAIARRIQITSSTANGGAMLRSIPFSHYRGSVAGQHGLFYSARFRNTALSATGGFHAIMANTTASIVAAARATNNSFGFGTVGGETTHRVYSRDGAAATAIDLGADFPANSATADFEFAFLAMPNVNNVRYMVRRLDIERKAQGQLTANLPTNTLALAWHIGSTVGGTAAANTTQFARICASRVY